jgi:collagenase-like PrtC family protease
MFSVPFNQTEEEIELYRDNEDIIKEIYAPISPNFLHTARHIGWSEKNDYLLEELLKTSSETSIGLNLLMNSINDDKIFMMNDLKDMLNQVYEYQKLGLKKVTVANPILYRAIVENLPGIDIGLSVIANADTIEKIKQFYDFGNLVEYCVPPKLTRNRDFIEKIKSLFDGVKIKMMVNCFCNPNCVGFIHHHIEASSGKKEKDTGYFNYVCSQHTINPLKKNIIFPNEIEHYSEYVDVFKISGRETHTETMSEILDLYRNPKKLKEYNFLKVLDGYKAKGAYLYDISPKNGPSRNLDLIENCDYMCIENKCDHCGEMLAKNFEFMEGEL